jgi:chemotaxis protein MotA
MRKFFTLFGISGFFAVVWFASQGRSVEYRGYFNFPSFLLVVVGHLLIVMYSYTVSEIYQAWKKSFAVLFLREDVSFDGIVSELVSYSRQYQKSGRIVPQSKNQDSFLNEAVAVFNNNYSVSELKKILRNKWQARRLKGFSYVSFFDFSAKIAPALGMMGTILGLISLLQNMDDFTKIGSGMALALLTTFYGLIVSYTLYYPISRRLYVAIERESILNAIVVEGLELIKNQVYGPILKENLEAFRVGNEESLTRSPMKQQENFGTVELEV